MKYSSKVWLITILISPLVLMLILVIRNSDSISNVAGIFQSILILIALDLVIFLPALLLFWVLQKKILVSNLNIWKGKIILILVGILFIKFSFFFFGSGLQFFNARDSDEFLWIFINSSVFSLAVILSKFDKKYRLNPNKSI